MTLFRHPDRLIDLSLHALCKYVSNLVDIYVENPCSIEDIHWHLERLFKDSVPQPLVNKVTENLLWSLDAKLKHIDKNLSKLFDIIILPTVTKLDFCLDSLHQVPYKVFNYQWNGHIIPEVLQRVNKLNNLKVLRIFHTFYGKYLFPCSLLEFTYHNNCDNKVLKQVSECCKGLKKLDLYNSNCIGDSSIKFILKFKFLEHVDLFGTGIKEKGMTELLTKKAEENACQLKHFGCTNLTGRQFEILTDKFPRLTCIRFSFNSGCEFDLLRNLTFLKSFSIDNVSARDLEKILDAVGSQLICLHFGCSHQFDLHKLALKCTAVNCLHINSRSENILVPNVKKMKEMPGLKSVKYLYANLYYNPHAVACLISMCQDVELLEVNNDNGGHLIADAILKKPMTSLRELNWYCSRDVKDVALRIVQHCPNLEVLRGYYAWKKCGNINNDIPLDRNFDLLCPL